MMARVFKAKYNSTCTGCPDPILIGEYVTYAGDYLVHEECAYSGETTRYADSEFWDDED